MGGLVGALDEAIAVPDDGGDVKAAQEAQLLVAFLHSRIAGQVTGLLFLIANQRNVGGNGIGIQVPFRHVQRQEQNLGMLAGHRIAGRSKQIAGHYNHAVAVGHRLIDGVDAVLIGISGGLIIVALQIVLFAELGHAFIGILVEGVVVDVAHVGDKGNLLGPGGVRLRGIVGRRLRFVACRFGGGVRRLIGRGICAGVGLLPVAALTAGKQTGHHHHCQQQRNDFLHFLDLQICNNIGILQDARLGAPLFIF